MASVAFSRLFDNSKELEEQGKPGRKEKSLGPPNEYTKNSSKKHRMEEKDIRESVRMVDPEAQRSGAAECRPFEVRLRKRSRNALTKNGWQC